MAGFLLSIGVLAAFFIQYFMTPNVSVAPSEPDVTTTPLDRAVNAPAQPQAVFRLADNDLTVECPGGQPGDTGMVNGVTYTKMTINDLVALVSSGQFEALEESCTSDIDDMRQLFAGAATFNADISHWDTSNVTDMSQMFLGATVFNQPIGPWDTSNVTDMSYMFSNAVAFNQEIGTWDTATVMSMFEMFGMATVFNRNINTKQVTKNGVTYTAWDTSNVTDMNTMFVFAESFNQAIGDWDTSRVTDMSTMFFGALAFNQDLSGWCVSHFTTPPDFFNTEANADWVKNTGLQPKWGSSCQS